MLISVIQPVGNPFLSYWLRLSNICLSQLDVIARQNDSRKQIHK